MTRSQKLLLIYSPPLMLGLVALFVFPILRTGDGRSSDFRMVRGILLGVSLLYTIIVGGVRMLLGVGDWWAARTAKTDQQRGFEVVPGPARSPAHRPRGADEPRS